MAVKEELQPSAIDEYAVVKVTTTVKSQVEGVHDLVIYNYLLIQAVRPTVAQSVETIKLSPLGDATFNLDYKTTKQVIKLDVRAFETAIGGRDILTSWGNAQTWPLYKALYNTDKELTGYTAAFTTDDYANDWNNVTTYSTDVIVADGDAFVWFKKAQGNATDSLFLIIGAKTQVEENTFYLKNGTIAYNNVSTPYAIYSNIDNKYFVTTINNLSVTRNFDATVKEEYSAQTIIGKWSADKTTYSLESNSFQDMYTLKPADAVAKYYLDTEKQNKYVQQLIADDQLTFNNTNYTVKFGPRVDVAQVKELKIDIYDGTVAEDNFYRTDTWKVQSPIRAFAGTADLGKYYDATLVKGTTVDFMTYAKSVVVNEKSVWDALVLKDYIGQNVVKYNAITAKFDLLAAEETLYRTNEAESTGLEFTTKTEGWTINADNKLECTIDPTGTIYTKVVTVTVSYVHDWGTTSFDFDIEVIRDVKP